MGWGDVLMDMTLVCKWRIIVFYGLEEILALIGVFVKNQT
jgi:hypothetical protein